MGLDAHEKIGGMSQTAQALKEKGNALFEKGDDAAASATYTEALSVCPEEDKNTRRVLHSNRSAARLRAGDADGALKDAEACLLLGPGWSKALYRKGVALVALNRFAEAVTALEGALLGDPSNETYKASLEKARRGESDPVVSQNSKSSTSSNQPNASSDPLADFFSEIEEIQQKAVTKVFQVDHEAETAGWTSANQIDRILQKHYKFLNLNPYHVFGLGHAANEEDIKKRYHRLSALVHPDKNQLDPRAREAFEIVKKAYDELKDEARRALFLQTFDVCRQQVEQSRKEQLALVGGREDLLVQQYGSFEKAFHDQITRVLALNEKDRRDAERIRAQNEEAIARTQMEKEPNWAEVKREQDELKRNLESRTNQWSEFNQSKKRHHPS